MTEELTCPYCGYTGEFEDRPLSQFQELADKMDIDQDPPGLPYCPECGVCPPLEAFGQAMADQEWLRKLVRSGMMEPQGDGGSGENSKDDPGE